MGESEAAVARSGSLDGAAGASIGIAGLLI
jgi:hypothetical protein